MSALSLLVQSSTPNDQQHLQGLSKPGAILGCDFVGEVVKIGDAVPAGEVNEGELRWGFMRGGLSDGRGAFAEYVHHFTGLHSHISFVGPMYSLYPFHPGTDTSQWNGTCRQSSPTT